MSSVDASDVVVEAALHAFVSQRCRRAYVHDLRNGLQGVYASIDVLTRIADGKAPANITSAKVREMARGALQAHDTALNKAVADLTVQSETASVVDLSALSHELIGFLGNDAAVHEVTLATGKASQDSARATARPSRCRLLLLGLLTRAIDAMQAGGTVTIDCMTSGATACVELRLLSNDDAIADESGWADDSNPDPNCKLESWIFAALRRVARTEGGDLETDCSKTGANAEHSYQRRVILKLTAAGSP